MDWRLINSGYLDGYTNMAIDKAMFSLIADGNIPPTLRLYGWSPAALTIGYFQIRPKSGPGKSCPPKVGQPVSEKRLADDYKGVDVIRRLTGGGAIFHDQELTFCLVADLKKTIIPEDIFESYQFISRAVINGLKNLGIGARMRGEKAFADKEPLSEKEEPFFCFDRSSKYDIIFKGKKIAGSAQRRSKGILLHHGSILLDRENLETSISVNSILNRKVEFEELGRNMINAFKKKLSVNLMKGELTLDEQKLVTKIIGK